MFPTRIGLAGLAAVAVLALSTSDASAQYLPPQYFAPGYGAYYRTYPTPYGGVVNRTSYTTPYGTNYTHQYYNPYTGYGNSTSSFSSYYGNYNTPFISNTLLNPYGSITPLYVNGLRVR